MTAPRHPRVQTEKRTKAEANKLRERVESLEPTIMAMWRSNEQPSQAEICRILDICSTEYIRPILERNGITKTMRDMRRQFSSAKNGGKTSQCVDEWKPLRGSREEPPFLFEDMPKSVLMLERTNGFRREVALP